MKYTTWSAHVTCRPSLMRDARYIIYNFNNGRYNIQFLHESCFVLVLHVFSRVVWMQKLYVIAASVKIIYYIFLLTSVFILPLNKNFRIFFTFIISKTGCGISMHVVCTSVNTKLSENVLINLFT